LALRRSDGLPSGLAGLWLVLGSDESDHVGTVTGVALDQEGQTSRGMKIG
jgi:hypothetical protein